ncbi:MAG: VCBS repeat-containing protein [Planctomycetota bacterium]
MSPKLTNALIAVLGLGVAVVYGSWFLKGNTQAPVPSVDEAPALGNVRSRPIASPLLPVRSLDEGLFDSGHWRGKPALADLNGDGHLDLIASLRKWEEDVLGDGLHVWLGDGAGKWTLAIEGLLRGDGYGGSDVADIDGDGHLDFAFSSHDSLPQVYLGDGTGKWTEASGGINLTGPSVDLALGDVDGDGRPELATVGQFSPEGGVHLFRFESDGGFWTKIAVLLDEDTFGEEIEIQDLDGDGRGEIVATTEVGPKVWSLEDDDSVREWSNGLPTPSVGGADLGLECVDLDGDGFLELLVSGHVSHDHEPLRAFRWNGEAWERWGEGLPNDQAYFDLTLANLDGEGVPEIIANGKFATVVLRVEGDRFVTLGQLPDTSNVSNIIAGDVDGDGRDDLVYLDFAGLHVVSIESLEGTLVADAADAPEGR